SPFRRLSVEERAQLQSIVDDLHARFREIVGRGRPKLSPEEIERLASGRVFSAKQALELGLVDRIGSLEAMVEDVERRIGAPQSRVVSYHRPREIRRNLHSRSAAGAFGVAGVLGGNGSPDRRLARQGWEQLLGVSGFAYLWWPGLVGQPAMVGSLQGSGFIAGAAAPARPSPFAFVDQLVSWGEASSPAAADSPEKDVPSEIPRTNIAD
ncbi:MAG: S49 family peptidase, partial [Myxococcota bacterium]